MSQASEEKYGYTIGQQIEARDTDDPRNTGWRAAKVTGLWDYDDGSPVEVQFSDTSGLMWLSLDNVRAKPSGALATQDADARVQVRVNVAGPAFARTTGEWQTVEIGAMETLITIPPCSHQQQVAIRRVPKRTEAEILAEARAKYRTSNRLEMGKILKGEF